MKENNPTNKTMKTTRFSDEENTGISIELDDGRGFDAYTDGAIIPWDGNGAFTVCEATRNLHCFSSRDAVLGGIRFAESSLGCSLNYAAVLPGSEDA